MKTAQFSTFFKLTAADKDAGKTTKRPDLVVSYNAVESDDVINSEVNAIKLAYIVNNALESFAKRLIAANKDNWDYVPASESITVDNLYAELTAESSRGKRILSKENLQSFATYYLSAAQSVLGKSLASAQMGEKVILAKLAQLTQAKEETLIAFSTNLATLVESPDFPAEHANTVEALCNLITEMLNPAESVDIDLI